MAPTRTQARLTDPGAMLAAAHELRDGNRARIRLTRPSDAPRVRAFLERLSPETRRRRFLSPMPSISEAVVRHFTFYDPRERVMIAATAPGAGVEEIVGLADVALLETGVAEIGLVVDEEHQGRGIGQLLSEAVASIALARGARRLRAEMAGGNAPMLALLTRIGPTARRIEGGTSVAYVRLPADRRLVAA